MLPNLLTLTSGYKTAARYRANEQWTEKCEIGNLRRTNFKLTLEPSASVFYKFNVMSRTESSEIVQARMRKIGLWSYLHSIGVEDSRNCTCGEEAQSVQHILLCCPEFEELRETMWETQRKTDLKTLLELSELAKRAVQFLINTRLLTQFSWANLSSTEEDVSNVDIGETEAEDI